MDTPCFHTEVECPVCGTANEYETIRVGAYVESGRDTDFCPLGVKWRFDEYSGYSPLVFFVATCPKCFYSREFNDSFKNWKSDATFKTYRLKRTKTMHLGELSVEGSIIKQIGQSIDLERSPNESAISKLLLAIRDELLNEIPSNIDLGRWYLRISWVMRHLSAANPGVMAGGDPLSSIDRDFNSWSKALNSFTGARGRLYEALERSLKGSDQSSDSPQGKMKLQYAGLKEQLAAHEARFQSLVNEMSDAISGHRKLVGAATDSVTTAPFGGHESLREFLEAIKRDWPGAPVDEREALEMAADRYQAALENGKEVAAGNQQIQVCYLIAELSRRVGDYKKAREYFNSVMKVGQQFVRKYQNDRSLISLAQKILDLSAEQVQLTREESLAGKR